MANKTFWYRNRVTVPGISIAARTPHEMIRKFDATFQEKYGESIVDVVKNNGGRTRVSRRIHRQESTTGMDDVDFTIRKQLARGRRRGW